MPHKKNVDGDTDKYGKHYLKFFMNIPDKFVYLLATIPFCIIWAVFLLEEKI